MWLTNTSYHPSNHLINQLVCCDRQDKDGNGSISIDELREGLTTVMGSEADPDAAVNIMAALDVSGASVCRSSAVAFLPSHNFEMSRDKTIAGPHLAMSK